MLSAGNTTSFNSSQLAVLLTYCSEWKDAQHALYQTANVFSLAAFVIPHTFPQSVLLVRSLVCTGYMMLVLWSAFDVCAPDVFVWNLVFIIISVIHLAYLGWIFIPARIPKEQSGLYNKVFVPLKVSRESFVSLTRAAQLRYLEVGSEYFTDYYHQLQQLQQQQQHYNSSNQEQRLSVLLKGKLKVTYGSTLLHHVHPLQFIDSPEWYTHIAFPNRTRSFSPQVSVTAVEPCTYLLWPSSALNQAFTTHQNLEFILDCLIGKDVSQKLYSVAERLALEKRGTSEGTDSCTLTPEPSALGPWEQELLRSQSVDAVHTCNQGQVRSIHWRRNETKQRWHRRYEKLVALPNDYSSYCSPSLSTCRRSGQQEVNADTVVLSGEPNPSDSSRPRAKTLPYHQKKADNTNHRRCSLSLFGIGRKRSPDSQADNSDAEDTLPLTTPAHREHNSRVKFETLV